MDNEFLDKIDEIIDMLEDNEYKSYLFKDNKFHIIDKEKDIDFTVKLGINNYYYKDNSLGLTYIFSKKYLNEDTTIQQILVEDKSEKCYYAFLERNNLVEFIRIVRKDEKGSFICDNNNLMKKNFKEIIDYANEVFEFEDNYRCEKEFNILASNMEDSTNNIEFENDKISKSERKATDKYYLGNSSVDNLDKYNEYDDSEYDSDKHDDSEYDDNEYDDGEYDDSEYDDDEYDGDEYDDSEYDDDEYDDEYNDVGHDSNEYDDGECDDEYEDGFGYEYKQIEENNNSFLSDQFNKNTIADYETYILQEESKENTNDITEYEEALLENLSLYKLVINGSEIDGKAKIKIISDCEVAIEEKYDESILMKEGVQNLKSVLEAKHKEEYDR